MYLQHRGFTHLSTVTSDELTAGMIVRGHIHAWAGSEYVQRYLFAKIGEDPSKLQSGPMIGPALHIYIAGHVDFPKADAKAIADGVNSLRSSGKLDAILNKYR